MPNSPIRITDVSPRDGLQNEAGVISTADKAELVRLVAAAGVDEVEVGSFVSPKWVPQLADTPELLADLAERSVDIRPVFSALVPNERGMQGAIEQIELGRPLDKVAVFTAASETFSRKNTNASIAETIERFRPVLELAGQHGIPVRGYISCIIACPFEGPIAPDAVLDVSQRLLDLGVDELDLGDTIGRGTPETIAAALRPVLQLVEDSHVPVTLHLHDTFGYAADCVREALLLGVESFDGSAAGLGGCPYASTPGNRAPGNISTELLVRTIHAEGGRTSVDEAALREAAAFARRVVAESRAKAEASDSEGGAA